MDQKSISNAGAQIVYFSHGGGPLPILGDPGHRTMIDFMTALPEKLHRPEMILVISAHWEERVPTLLGAEYPPMFYDYYGFPAESYEINYPAPGSPALVDMVTGALQKNGFPCAVDPARGYDHGHFIPLKVDVSPGRYSHYPAFAHPGIGCGNTHPTRESSSESVDRKIFW